MKQLRLSFLLILIALCLPLNAASVTTEEPHPSPEPQTDPKIKDEEIANGLPLTVDQRKAKESPDQINDDKTVSDYYFGDFKNLTILISAVATAFIALFAGGQIYFLRKIMHATKTAAEAAQGSADAAFRQGTILANLERPWLVADKPGIQGWPPTNDQQPIQITWSITNVGRSLAFLTQVLIRVEILPIPIPEPPNYPAVTPFAELVIPPGGVHRGFNVKSKTTKTFEDLKAGKSCIIFYGRLEYNDTLRGRPHQTRFCSYWYVDGSRYIYSPVGPPSYIEYT